MNYPDDVPKAGQIWRTKLRPRARFFVSLVEGAWVYGIYVGAVDASLIHVEDMLRVENIC